MSTGGARPARGFRAEHPAAWTFHAHSSRWIFNMRPIPEGTRPVAPFKEDLDAPLLRLPAPRALDGSLEAALEGRFSCRRFTGAELDLAELATVLHTAYGVRKRVRLGSEPHAVRPVPSGGGLYPLELYVLAHAVGGLAQGVYHYAALHHGLEEVRPGPLPVEVSQDLFFGQAHLRGAGAVVVVSGVPERTMWKYEERGYRFLLFEAGHVVQNACLAASALGRGALPLGGFLDEGLGELLGLRPDAEIPLYGLALGHAEPGAPEELRMPRA